MHIAVIVSHQLNVMQAAVSYVTKLIDLISPREREVLELLSQGQSSAEIASTLFLSPYTVNDHRKALLWKLDAKNVAQMIRRGFELQLLQTSTTALS
ncbi:MAG: helix-turn-helix transcriptional regulator [Bacteroidota bacterium]